VQENLCFLAVQVRNLNLCDRPVARAVGRGHAPGET
jgi:hypothetical protein